MSWTTTPPTTPGSKYWRWNKSQKDYDIYRLYIIDGGKLRVTAMSPSEIGGEWWDSPVPEPGTAFTVKETLDFITPYFTKGYSVLEIMHKFTDPKDGIAAVTTKGEK